MGVDGGGEAPEQPRPVTGGHGPPRLEGGGGRRDGGVGLLGAQALDLVMISPVAGLRTSTQ